MKELFFDDDTFTDDRARAEEIARGLGRLGITWSCNAKANVPRETLAVLRDNGLRLLSPEAAVEDMARIAEPGVFIVDDVAFIKRSTPMVNNQALELARSMGLSVAINIIADPDWDEARFPFVRECATSVTVSTPTTCARSAYQLPPPAEHPVRAPGRKELFVHAPPARERRR
jgi:hypothetical protein